MNILFFYSLTPEIYYSIKMFCISHTGIPALFKTFNLSCFFFSLLALYLVGAGDSLSAGFLYMMLKGAPLQQALAFGSTLADYVCAHQGAIPEYDKELLNKFHYVQDKEGTF